MRKSPLLVLAAAAAVLAAGAAARPAGTTHSCVKGNELWFNAADGTKLVGHRFGKGTTAVILAQQNEGDLCQWVPYARSLAAQGYTAFPFDLRGFGFSQRRPGRLGLQVQRDVIAAVKAMRAQGKTKIFVVGASYGALAAVVAAPNLKVAGVVSLSAPDVFQGLNGITAAQRTRLPILYVASNDDQEGRFATAAQKLFAATAATDKQLELTAGNLHGIELLQRTPNVKRLLESFLRSH